MRGKCLHAGSFKKIIVLWTISNRCKSRQNSNGPRHQQSSAHGPSRFINSPPLWLLQYCSKHIAPPIHLSQCIWKIEALLKYYNCSVIAEKTDNCIESSNMQCVRRLLTSGSEWGPGFNQRSLASPKRQMFQGPLNIHPLTNPKLGITAARYWW